MPCGAQLEVVQASVRHEDDINITDHADLDIRVLPILPRERIDQIIRDELERRGWERQPDGALTKRVDDTIATLPAGSNTIRVTIADERKVSVVANVKERIAEGDEAARAAVGRKAEQEAARKLADASDQARRELEEAAAARLLKVWQELRSEVDEVVNATARRALEERAAELGSIESIQEGQGQAGGYELTITVRT